MRGFGGFWVVLGGFGGGADNVLGCPPYKIFSWTCCYAIHSSLAPYPGTRYQVLLVTCKTLLIFALLFLGGFWGWFWGGLITFLAARLTRYCLGLAATLSTLLLGRYPEAHAAPQLSGSCNLQPETAQWFLHCYKPWGGFGGGWGYVPWLPALRMIFSSWTCCYAIQFYLVAPYPGTRYQVLLVNLQVVTHTEFLPCVFCFLGGFWGGFCKGAE